MSYSTDNAGNESEWVVVSVPEKLAPDMLTPELLRDLGCRLLDAAESMRSRIQEELLLTENQKPVALLAEVGGTEFQFRVALDGDRAWGPFAGDDKLSEV